MTDTYRELLLGCGHARDKRLGPPNTELKWRNLVTTDCYAECAPDVLCNLDAEVWAPFSDGIYDEVHAYEVLEHLGQQGYARQFFATFKEIYRILKPGGYLFATTPSRHSPWLWGDPSHRRVIIQESLAFLDQRIIHANRENNTPMSDFSALWQADFEVMGSTDDHVTHIFCLKAHKPVRVFP